MADENIEVNEEAGKQLELSPVEQRAMEQGWVPQDQWDGPEDQWRPAKEFLDRGELFEKINAQNRDLKELRKALVDLRNHNAKIAEIEYKRALADLKSQKREALADGNVDAVMDIDDKIEAVKEAQQAHAAPEVPQPSEVNPIFQTWLQRNKWFESNRVMRAYANDLGKELAMRGLSPAEVLEQVEQEVKKEFADKFRNPARERPGAVEGSTHKGRSGSSETMELTDMERQVMQRLIKTIPGFTKEKYLADLKKIKGV